MITRMSPTPPRQTIALFFGNGNGYEAPAYRRAGVSYIVKGLRLKHPEDE
jgi:hypothetical protein